MEITFPETNPSASLTFHSLGWKGEWYVMYVVLNWFNGENCLLFISKLSLICIEKGCIKGVGNLLEMLSEFKRIIHFHFSPHNHLIQCTYMHMLCILDTMYVFTREETLALSLEVNRTWHLTARCRCPPVILKNCGLCPQVRKSGCPARPTGINGPAGLTSRKIRLFCRKKTLKFKFSLKKFTNFGFLHSI
jgi:hypothetical protein